LNDPSLRTIQLYAEAFALKGLCLEQAQSKNMTEIINCFQLSSDMALEHSKVLTSQFRQHAGQRASSEDDSAELINPLFEIALQKTPLLFVSIGDINSGLKKFRELLLKRHLQSIASVRQCLFGKFSECLMSSICESNYFGFDGLFKNNEK
jgi:hypothetical protein